ncbi:MAG: acyl-CoA dehydrogenase family protein [Acidobacteria bacterium]|nr:acyl-CoA dehydrogenase family protein [Acidobacteriota bacterium]
MGTPAVKVREGTPPADAPETEAPAGAKGSGGFLTSPVSAAGVFVREMFTPDQLDFADTARKFVDTEVLPRLDEIEHKKTVTVGDAEMLLVVQILKKSGELGLLGAEVPEEYGGLGLDKITGMLIAESMSGCPSFSTTVGAHAGIGTMPIVIFGNEEQKQRYLPLLASAEIVSCYALTEPGSGSDALSGKTRAVLNADGTHYAITGEKMFITNGAWADIGIVFAGIDGKYSAFIVDLRSPGVSRGAEEKKMGLHGSSTTSLTFDGTLVPRENLLGKPGDAATIALNILNLGRMKLGFGSLGTCKFAIDRTVAYGRERRQFGRPIIEFDMQKGKLGTMVARTYAVDALGYRVVGAIDAEIAKLPKGEGYQQAVAGVLRNFALEASILKIAGSETLHDVLDSAVKMHGGYGFVEEYHVERLARDNVIDMIYEGTNDINRMVIVDSLVRAIYGGVIGSREYMEQVDSALRTGRLEIPAVDGPLGQEVARVAAAKRAVAFAVNEMILNCGTDIKNEQQVMQAIADALIALYGMESTLARALAGRARPIPAAIARLIVHEGSQAIARLTAEVLSHVVTGGRLPAKLARLDALNRQHGAVVDTMALRTRIADSVIEAGKYNL